MLQESWSGRHCLDNAAQPALVTWRRRSLSLCLSLSVSVSLALSLSPLPPLAPGSHGDQAEGFISPSRTLREKNLIFLLKSLFPNGAEMLEVTDGCLVTMLACCHATASCQGVRDAPYNASSLGGEEGKAPPSLPIAATASQANAN